MGGGYAFPEAGTTVKASRYLEEIGDEAIEDGTFLGAETVTDPEYPGWLPSEQGRVRFADGTDELVIPQCIWTERDGGRWSPLDVA